MGVTTTHQAAIQRSNALVRGQAIARRALSGILIAGYRIIGMAILLCLLVGLASFMFVQVFFLVNTHWVTPMILSPADTQVIELNNQLVQASSLLEKLVADREELSARSRNADRITKGQRDFQERLKHALETDLADNQKALGRVEDLRQNYQADTGNILSANRDFSNLSRDEVENLYRAHLIDKNTFLSWNVQLSQITNSNLSLAQKNVELDTQSQTLSREGDSLQTLKKILSSDRQVPKSDSAPSQMSIDVLRIKAQYDTSLAESQKAADDQAAVSKTIAAMDDAITQQERVVRQIRNSAYIKAADENLTVVFVPYANISNVSQGDAIYGCRFKAIWCYQVGRISEILQGEVTAKHPIYNKEQRGVLARIEVVIPSWARQDVLYVGKPPLSIQW